MKQLTQKWREEVIVLASRADPRGTPWTKPLTQKWREEVIVPSALMKAPRALTGKA
jgi:hypothetical protein